MGGPWEDYKASSAPWEDFAPQSSEWQGDTSGRSMKDLQREFILKEGGTKDVVKQRVKDVVPYIRPTVEALGTVGGGLLGATAGLGIGSVPGGVAGAALGYAGTKNIMDTLEGNWANSPTEAVTRAATDLGTGAMYEMGGQIAGPIIGSAFRGAKNTVKFIKNPVDTTSAGWEAIAKKAASRRLQGVASKDPVIAARSAANQAEYDGVKEAIPEFNLTPAQATDDPALLQLQQKLQFAGTDAKAALEAQTMNNRGAIESFRNNSMPEGTLDDFLQSLQGQTQARGQAVDSAMLDLSGAGKEAAGQAGRELAIAQRSALKQQANGLYSQVPENMTTDSTPLYRKLQELGDSVDPAFADPRNMPSGTIGRARGALEPEPSMLLGADGKPYNMPRMAQDIPNDMTYGQLMQYSEQVGKALRQAKSIPGQEMKAANLLEIKSGIEQTLQLAERNGQGAGTDALRAANKFYRETYVPIVRRGATAKNLATDATGGFRVDDAKVMGQYFQAGDNGIAGANSFNATFKGNPEAKQALLDYAKSDLETAITGAGDAEAAVNKWLFKHDNAIKKLGMDNEFTGLKDALKSQSEVARLGKVLDSTDPHQTMKALFQGANGKSSVRNILDLKTLVKGDEKALNGLKRSFSDMMMAESGLAKQMGDDYLVSSAKLKTFWDKYEPAMKLLYTKEELAAMQTIRKAFDMENRVGRVISGVNGSQTRDMADSVNNALSKWAQWDWKGRMLRFALDTAKLQKSVKVQEYIVKAQFDPKFAKELAAIADVGKRNGEDAMKKAFNDAAARYATGASVILRDSSRP